jgi:hypothetical protein
MLEGWHDLGQMPPLTTRAKKPVYCDSGACLAARRMLPIEGLRGGSSMSVSSVLGSTYSTFGLLLDAGVDVEVSDMLMDSFVDCLLVSFSIPRGRATHDGCRDVKVPPATPNPENVLSKA